MPELRYPRLLLTGATGYIGQACLPLLLYAGYEVHALSRSASPPLTHPKLHWHQVDLLDHAQLEPALSKIKADSCLHLAWYAEHGKFWHAEENQQWLETSLYLIDRFYENGGRRFMVSGTCAEYGVSDELCIEEKTPLEPATRYGQCKLQLQIELERKAQAVSREWGWARLFFPYGGPEPIAKLTPSICRALLAKQTASTRLDAQQRDFIHIDDAAELIIRLLNATPSGAFNLCSGQPVSIRTFASEIANQLDAITSLDIGHPPASSNEPELIAGDVTRLRDAIGDLNLLSLSEGIRRTIEYWRLNNN